MAVLLFIRGLPVLGCAQGEECYLEAVHHQVQGCDLQVMTEQGRKHF